MHHHPHALACTTTMGQLQGGRGRGAGQCRALLGTAVVGIATMQTAQPWLGWGCTVAAAMVHQLASPTDQVLLITHDHTFAVGYYNVALTT